MAANVCAHPSYTDVVTPLRAAFLTMQNPGDFVTDFDLCIPPLAALGWDTDLVAWREPSVDWSRWHAVYICTPWDYLDDPAAFMKVLESIDRSSAILVNDIALVRWTLEKSYLAELESRGAPVVPSSWHEHIDAREIESFFERHGTERVVIKPLVGANAADTFVLTWPVSRKLCERLTKLYRCRRYFVQPYLEAIENEGEYSLFYLGGELSHAIRKKPAKGDFRVQEEHGASIAAIQPSKSLIEISSRIVALVEPPPVYARADFVRGANDRLLLMELELIEPSLYLRTDAGAPRRFARSFDRHVRRRLRGD